MSDTLMRSARPSSGIVLRHGGDTLPAQARAKLAALDEALTATDDASFAAYKRRMAASADARRAEEALRQISEHSKPDLAQVKAATAAVTEARAIEDRRAVLSDEATAAADPLRRLVARITAYIEQGHEGLREAPPIALKASPALAVQLHDARLRIEELSKTREAIATAPAPDSEIAEAIRAQVDELAAKGRPLHVGQHESVWRTESAETWTDGHIAGLTHVPDAPALMAWLQPEVMRQRLLEQIMAERRAAGAVPGLPKAERKAKLAQLEAMLLDSERLEEGLLEAMEAKGTSLPRRETADVRAVLAIVGPPPAAD